MSQSDVTKEIPYLSVIIPIYNEEDNLPTLIKELHAALAGVPKKWEVIFVDDGSEDKSWEKLQNALTVLSGGGVKLIRLARNYGQTIALRAGIKEADGEIIVTMDADLQNDPADVPILLSEIEKGADVVSGWRRKRKDALFSRRIPSRLGNWFVAWQTGVKLRDFGCSLKAYRADMLKEVKLYGETHRLIPALTAWMGAKIVEVEVNHRPRKSGKSKYNIGRVFAVLLDIISLKFFSVYAIRPTHIIGVWGILCMALSVISAILLVLMKIHMNMDMTGNPFLILSAMFFMVGVQLIALGLLGELNARAYYETQNNQPYRIKEIRNG